MTTASGTVNGTVSRFDISAAEDAEARAWVVRLHLRPGQRAVHATVDGVAVVDGAAVGARLVHLAPLPQAEAEGFFPFGGKGARPAPGAGYVVELALPSAATARVVEIRSS